jgi:hypothetical protein
VEGDGGVSAEEGGMKYQITDESASLTLFDDSSIRQIIAQGMQRKESALLDAILRRLNDRGRILPGEELYRERDSTGLTVCVRSTPYPSRRSSRQGSGVGVR